MPERAGRIAVQHQRAAVIVEGCAGAVIVAGDGEGEAGRNRKILARQFGFLDDPLTEAFEPVDSPREAGDELVVDQGKPPLLDRQEPAADLGLEFFDPRRLVAISGAQAARTQDGRYVLVDQSGRPLSQPVTGGQLGAYLFHAMDEKSRAAQAEMQGKIALEEAKQRAIAQGKLTEQGGTGAELESLKSLLEQERNRNKPPEYSFLSPVTGGVYAGNKATGAITPYTQLDAVPLPR